MLPVLFDQRSQYNSTELDGAVISLQDDRSGLAFVGIGCNGSEPFDHSLINNFLAVQKHRHLAADQPYVECLPFACTLARIFARHDTAIQRSVAVPVRRAA